MTNQNKPTISKVEPALSNPEISSYSEQEVIEILEAFRFKCAQKIVLDYVEGANIDSIMTISINQFIKQYK